MTEWDEIRRFFGEEPEVLSAPQIAPPASKGERRGTFDDYHQWWIDDGHCPLPGCHRELDSEGCCPGCGWSILEEKMRKLTPEDRDDYVTTLPLALTLDEYAPAEVDAA